MRVTKIYDDGRLVSCKSTGKPTSAKADSRCLSALRKEVTYEMNSFILSVSTLRKELSRAERLLKARTSERDSAKKAHRKRLQQVYTLKSKIEDLKLDSLIMQEDLDSLNKNSFVRVQCVGDNNQPLSGSLIPDKVNSTGVDSKVEKIEAKNLPVVGHPRQSDYTFGIKAKAVKKG